MLVNIHDDAWVAGGGPQGAANAVGWMKNDREVYFLSEKTGYAQLYAVAFEGGEPRALTNGNWEVLNVRQSRDKSKFYLIANADGPADQFLYEMSGDGGTLTRISKAPGKHTAVLSPDEHWIADVYSYSNRPPDLYVQENAVHGVTSTSLPLRELSRELSPEIWVVPLCRSLAGRSSAGANSPNSGPTSRIYPVNFLRSASRPRVMRDFTVPSEIARTSAISSY